MNNRRLFIIVIAVIVLIAIGIASYFLFFRQQGGLVTDPTGGSFGDAGDYTGGGEPPEVGQDQENVGEEFAPSLVRITEGPVAHGSLILLREKTVTITAANGSTTEDIVIVPEVRYVERKSGNVYTYRPDERVLTRISNQTLPGIQEAIWTPDGATAFLRFASTNEGGRDIIDTYALGVETETGYLLEANLDQVLVTGTSTVVTFLPSTTGSIATAARVDGANPRTLFTSSLASLHLTPSVAGMTAYTKASAQTEGFGFLISSASVFTRLLGPYRGFTMLPSPSGKSIIYSYLSGQTVTAVLLDVATRTTTALPVAALPEKCVWSKDETAVYCAVPRSMVGTWPDSWYQGSASFSDRVWKIDIEAQNAVLVVDPAAVADTAIDAIALTVDVNDDYLVFTNKKDGSLWAYDL